MLSRSEWEHFEGTAGWQEVLATVKERMKIINLELLSPEHCDTNEKRIKLQAEYGTCLWFINLPKIDGIQEEEADDKKDHTVAPDLDPFRV